MIPFKCLTSKESILSFLFLFFINSIISLIFIESGINDTWAIKGANSTFYPSAQINIFNRFGKVVAQIDVDNPGWDGTYGGKILSSDDYWFSIILVDRNGNARERKGNFSLLRR